MGLCSDFSTLNHLKPSVSTDEQAQAVRELIQRNIGPQISAFNVSISADIGVTGKDTFKVCVTSSSLIIILQHCKLLVRAAWLF